MALFKQKNNLIRKKEICKPCFDTAASNRNTKKSRFKRTMIRNHLDFRPCFSSSNVHATCRHMCMFSPKTKKTSKNTELSQHCNWLISWLLCTGKAEGLYYRVDRLWLHYTQAHMLLPVLTGNLSRPRGEGMCVFVFYCVSMCVCSFK